MESLRQVRERNLWQIARESEVDREDAMLLQRISHRLHQLDVASCNWGWTPRQEKRIDRLEKQAQKIAKKYGFTAYHQSDPRGWSLYLVVAGVNPETHYNEGLGICPH